LKISDKALLKLAGETLNIEANSISGLKNQLRKSFVDVVRQLFACKGRVIVSGIGKSAIIAQKIVATLNSTGTPSAFLHAADAIHGDLGMIRGEDAVMVISKSGESPEIKVLVPLVKSNGNLLIGMVGNRESFLAHHSDLILDTTVSKEACPNNLAPTSSTTAQMVMGDALAVCLLKMRGFSPEDFAKFHPGGSLGRKLYLKVGDLYKQHPRPAVSENDSINTVIIEITGNRLGAAAVLNSRKQVSGIITDGDLRRMIEKQGDYSTLKAKDIMGRHPKKIDKDELAVNALELMRNNKITQVIVMDGKNYLGMVHVHDLLREGLV
jgi:arabinose-5-phosphate isomerase